MKTRLTLFFIVAIIYISQATMFAQTSDNFTNDSDLKSFWRFFNPAGGTYTMTGTNVEINVPSGTSHDLGSNKSPRILQGVPNSDLALEAKFESEIKVKYQMQGIVIHENDNNYIRFGTYSTDTDVMVYCAVYCPGVSAKINTSIGPDTPPYLRVERDGDQWTYSYSFDGSSFTQATSFNQPFNVTEAGVYGGNHSPNPAYIASVDYFRDLNDASFSDTDVQGVTPPTIDVWYGDTQTFGILGNPQKWVNILGRATDADGVSSVSYRLNGSEQSISLNMGPDTKRLLSTGDFVTEIDREDLINGENTVEFTATDALGAQTTKSVTINYEAGNVWPLPYSADFSSLSSIEDVNSVANIVDGLWELTPNGIRTTEPGYDRLIVIGDESWTTNYEVTAEFIINTISGGSGVGFAMGWQGHTGTASPRTQWPLEAIGWVWQSNGLEIWTYPSGIPASTSYTYSPNTKYFLKAKSEDVGGENSRYSLKIWEEGETEPLNYMIDAVIPDRNGSVLLITHKADVTWENIQIDPLTGNFDPSFTSTPVNSAQEGQAYTYNITASDPNTSDVLTISANTLPSWLSFSDNGNGSATLSGTPGLTDLGNHPVELEVSDGNGGSKTQNFTIVVTSTSVNLPLSDQFCGPNVEAFWTIYDPYDGQAGESTFGINNGVLEIAIPSGISHDLGDNDAPRLLQTIPDDDFGVEVKFNSVPSSTYQMQGIVVQGAGIELRFETFYGTIGPYTGEHFLANGYGIAFGAQYISQVGGAIPEYLRVVRTGNVFEFDYSSDGVTWSNIITKTLNFVATEVGFYGANAGSNPPAFTVEAEYFRNLDDPIPSCSIVEVTSPNGGETWAGGSTENITWTSTDVTNVKIEFSSDNGSNWNTVAASVAAASGTYAYTVPSINTTDGLIRISDVSNAGVFDISDAIFTITTPVSSVQVVSPNGGETWAGASTQSITWTSSNVTNVNIEFSSDNGSTWNTVATSVAAASGTYSYTVPNTSSTQCLVRISETGNASVFDVSDNTFTINAVVTNPTITIGSSTTVAGSYVTIPIDLTAPSGFKIDYLLQGKIHFDAAKLKFLYGGYDPGMLVNDFGWTGTFYSALPGIVDVILSGATPVNTSGTLFYLTFQVIDGSAGSVNLTSSTAEWPVDVLESPLTVVNGSVTYSAGSGTSTNRGDATLNYIVDIYDALAVIYHWIGFSPLTGQAFTNADADFDGDVDIDDYLRIIFFVYLHDWDFAFPSVSPSSSIAMGGAGFESSEIISVPLELSNSDNVQSVEVGFDFDPSKLEYVNTTSTNMGSVNIKSAAANGKLSVVAISSEEIQNGTVATVRFKKLKSNSSSEISTVYKLNNGKAAGNGMLSVGDGTITDVKDGDSDLPTKFELSQNYPNPFNPTTVIKFAVPKAGHFRLSVYNILGQRIMTLVDNQINSGYHSATFNGAGIASGIYIYSLEGENVNISRKMLLIK